MKTKKKEDGKENANTDKQNDIINCQTRRNPRKIIKFDQYTKNYII